MTKRLDWYHRRSGCNTCSRMDEFLDEHGIQVRETARANNEKLDHRDALELAGRVLRTVAARGKSVVTLDLVDDHIAEDDLTRHLVGPTRNLQAPTTRSGKTLLVGFNADAFAEELS